MVAKVLALRMRFWFEAASGSLCGSLAVLTLVVRDWVEALTGVDPDHSSGSLEWALAAVLALTCASMALAARREWGRHSAAAVASHA